MATDNNSYNRPFNKYLISVTALPMASGMSEVEEEAQATIRRWRRQEEAYEKGMYQCPVCAKDFHNQKTVYLRHVEQPVCFPLFSDHLREKYSDAVGLEIIYIDRKRKTRKIPLAQKLISCPECLKDYITPEKMREHLFETHNCLIYFYCTICSPFVNYSGDQSIDGCIGHMAIQHPEYV